MSVTLLPIIKLSISISTIMCSRQDTSELTSLPLSPTADDYISSRDFTSNIHINDQGKHHQNKKHTLQESLLNIMYQATLATCHHLKLQ